MLRMFARNDFAYFHGIVLQVTFREKVHTATQSGGGFVFRGTGFIAPPSVSVHSQTIQDFWLKGEQGERNFQIYGDDLPMRNGQEITALWYRDRLVAYANHATRRWLLLNGELSVVAGRKPKSTLFYTFVPPFLLLLLVAGVGSQDRPLSQQPVLHEIWGLIFRALLLAFLISPMVGFLVGFYWNRRYGARRRAIKELVKEELNLLFKSHLSS